jgi:hypothetical protein
MFTGPRLPSRTEPAISQRAAFKIRRAGSSSMCRLSLKSVALIFFQEFSCHSPEKAVQFAAAVNSQNPSPGKRFNSGRTLDMLKTVFLVVVLSKSEAGEGKSLCMNRAFSLCSLPVPIRGQASFLPVMIEDCTRYCRDQDLAPGSCDFQKISSSSP